MLWGTPNLLPCSQILPQQSLIPPRYMDLSGIISASPCALAVVSGVFSTSLVCLLRSQFKMDKHVIPSGCFYFIFFYQPKNVLSERPISLTRYFGKMQLYWYESFDGKRREVLWAFYPEAAHSYIGTFITPFLYFRKTKN